MMLRSNSASPDSPSIRMTRQGKHKIFVGMVAGVGKTYRMLEEAQRLKHLGKDVVIGLLETHDRPETTAKAEGLEIIPRQVVNRRGLIFHEMDTEAILERQPQLVLVDDLAHSNFPGSCRESRYQDVEVLLAAGIDVYSTVNIQHLASLGHVVTTIPGIVVKNSIPDRLLDTAKEVVVVDVTPETLQERLRQRKIFPSANIEQMLNTTFQWQHLAMLRELALRQVANNVEEVRLREGDRHNQAIAGNTGSPCCVHERILVCVSTEPRSIRLIKRGGHLANIMNASLYGLFVHNPERSLTQSEALYINTCERLCHDFRGEFLQISHFNTPETIAHVANTHHVSQVILGETRRSFWRGLFQQSIVDQLINVLPEQTDLHIISTGS